MFSGGEQRITLPAIIYLLLLWTPASFLFALIIIPEHKVNRAIKQILATPLLAVQFLLPFAIASESKVLNLVCSVLNFNVWLRFIGLFLVDPLVEENPAYTTAKNLWIEFWSCMREFPEVATKNGKASKVKEYTKDRSFYHIILLLFLELLTLDVIATWITSFSSREINTLATERPMLFFIFFVAANILLTSTFNSIGYALQLFYCIFIEGGSYSSGNYKIQIRVCVCVNMLLMVSCRTMETHDESSGEGKESKRILVSTMASSIQTDLAGNPFSSCSRTFCTWPF
ncbi:hypothetical protein RMATCC62417_00790 [Rhizopus microsporus]|nr:hypothetical protein RMATCC62417_00790 [Rhizopus microsporus]